MGKELQLQGLKDLVIFAISKADKRQLEWLISEAEEVLYQKELAELLQNLTLDEVALTIELAKALRKQR